MFFPQAAKWALAAPLARAQEGIFEALRYDAAFTHLIVNCHENRALSTSRKISLYPHAQGGRLKCFTRPLTRKPIAI